MASCSTRREVAVSFLGRGGGGGRTLFSVATARGVSIRRFSAYAAEDEVILAPGTQLVVTAVLADGPGGVTTIDLAEATGVAPLVT